MAKGILEAFKLSLYITLPISAAVLYNSPQTLSKIVENVRPNSAQCSCALPRSAPRTCIACTRNLAPLTDLPARSTRDLLAIRALRTCTMSGTAEELHQVPAGRTSSACGRRGHPHGTSRTAGATQQGVINEASESTDLHSWGQSGSRVRLFVHQT